MELKLLAAARLANSNTTQIIEKLSSSHPRLKYNTAIGCKDLSEENKIRAE
jgi:hypothetical protein